MDDVQRKAYFLCCEKNPLRAWEPGIAGNGECHPICF